MSYAKRLQTITGLLAAAMLLSACNDNETMPAADPSSTGEESARTTSKESSEQMSELADALAILKPTAGNNVSGSVRFTSADRGVQMEAKVNGLSPGKHGFHIHAEGDCSAPDASSAGGHYNPGRAEHGAPDDEEHHAGDLGNIEADEQGHAVTTKRFEFLTLTGDESIVGKAVVIHAEEDDFESQPSGDAGARVACGVIRDGGVNRDAGQRRVQ